ncbi:group II intron reverse transcriptase/maturase [Desulfolithobacter dissulfuricans]|uniref:Group II intron reverse transcriptase/maturase n=2 Tax=Desulfolithobacter dissulfuricans TaxID=2795293 RepID=A0A915XGV5_9BACT|nr:group II intron reverse transcriptase/maturase [Desulfolithobacter dissulfuricans]BCO07731.1 group II intron reverse transcriptase/maturase [Desulfolithobacter dissulfuricans]BCO07747.1 group II intron reverse transcriptase/maturase [Desulfolithobacter dissulfuricans]BCO07837.1 group II intron reverse transcriptase/maturase [Desulfolithobacter dissulfuricans]BCO07894.1 group II intron reverse transcriptase/maturase [Desulfolithobacter dissulfuricans]BCO09574.1 group II intron reverse transc
MVDVWYSLYDRMLSRDALHKAFGKVRSAKGAAGIDGQSIKDFAASAEANIDCLLKELWEKSYQPLAVRRVEIPKPTGGVRLLGIPAVRDRVVQQALLDILLPIFDRDFHPSSYGYRPGRSCHQAISKATMFIRDYDRKWVVDMDLSKCFDTLDHDLILSAFRRRIRDGSILGLLEKFLKSGVMTDSGFTASEIGSPQGGVISPLIANVYLDSFDQFMKNRGHRIVRYADDILILCQSKKAAENALEQARHYLEGELLLTVNREKTHICHSSRGVNFLGVSVCSQYTQIQRGKIKSFKAKVKAMTRRNSPVNLEKVIADLNPLLRGFANYFRIANCTGEFSRLMRWIRRRLRAIQLKLWKKPNRLHRRLRQLGYRGKFDAIKMNSWANAASPLSHYALPNGYLHRGLGLFDLGAVSTGISVSI